MAVALSAGSFDPVHLGHLAVIEHAAQVYEGVVVGVVANPEKSRGMFRPDERVRMVLGATTHLRNVSAGHFYGLTVEVARAVDATVLVRAAHKEWGVEFSMAAMNLTLAGIPTVLVPADGGTRAISSSVVRQFVSSGVLGPAQDLVPPCVGAALAALVTGSAGL